MWKVDKCGNQKCYGYRTCVKFVELWIVLTSGKIYVLFKDSSFYSNPIRPPWLKVVIDHNKHGLEFPYRGLQPLWDLQWTVKKGVSIGQVSIRHSFLRQTRGSCQRLRGLRRWSPESSRQSTRMPLDRSHSILYLLQSRQSTSTVQGCPQEIRSADKLWTYQYHICHIRICGNLIATRPCIVSFWTIKIKIPKSKRNTSRNGVFVNQRIECPTIFKTVKKVKKLNKNKLKVDQSFPS